jgi:hypothetical protein
MGTSHNSYKGIYINKFIVIIVKLERENFFYKNMTYDKHYKEGCMTIANRGQFKNKVLNSSNHHEHVLLHFVLIIICSSFYKFLNLHCIKIP